MTMVRAPRAWISRMLDSSLECSSGSETGDGVIDDDRQALLDQRDRAVLELAGGEALGVHVRQFLELERTLERHRVADVPAEEQHRLGPGDVLGELAHRVHQGQRLATASGISDSSSNSRAISSRYLVPRAWASASPTR